MGFLLFGSAEMALILIGLPIATLFVLMGWILAASWGAMKFTRTNVLLTKDQIATQKILFGFKDLDTTSLHAESRARLVESYSSDNKSVFAVRVNGSEDTLSFGTALPREDKDWMVTVVNDFLGQATLEPSSDDEDEDEVELDFVELAPAELPETSVVSVRTPSAEQMVLSSPSFPADQFRVYATLGFLAVFVLWLGVGIWHWTIPGISHTIGSIAVFVIAAAPLLLILFTLRGTITTMIDPNRFTTRYHIGWLGLRFRRPTPTAERVSVETSGEASDDNGYAGTIVQLGQSRLLAAWGTVRTCRQVAGLIRHHFRELGIETTDAMVDVE